MYPLTSEAYSTDGASSISEHVSAVSSLVMTEKKQSKPKEDTVAPIKHTVDVVTEDEDQLLTQLLAAKTEKNSLIEDKLYKASATADQTKTTLPDITDEENDNLLEELLAQPI